MMTPIASIIFECFVLGVFVPTEEMDETMTNMIMELFQEGRLCLIIQEGLWNFWSRNFMLSHPTYITCLSEVSSQFFKQNILGRFGRVGCNQFSALVMCFTPSGRIIDDRSSVEESKLQKPMVSSQDICPLVPNLSQLVVNQVLLFVNGCFNLDPNEVKFILELLRMSDLAIHDDRFKYACHANNYDIFFRLMSCYLVSQHCDLGDTKTAVVMTKDNKDVLSEFIKRLAINRESIRDFKFLTEAKKEEVSNSFLKAIC
jgi:hypothetical protein